MNSIYVEIRKNYDRTTVLHTGQWNIIPRIGEIICIRTIFYTVCNVTYFPVDDTCGFVEIYVS